MDDLIARIRNHLVSKAKSSDVPPSSVSAVEKGEATLGFRLPTLLRSCYLEVGNGGFGPGYGLIGFDGGAQSDYGSIAETYWQLRTDQEALGKQWPGELLPFCDWGCNIFSCVDCSSTDAHIHTFDAGKLSRCKYTLSNFFEMWLEGIDILAVSDEASVTRRVTNPFTGKNTTVRIPKPRE